MERSEAGVRKGWVKQTSMPALGTLRPRVKYSNKCAGSIEGVGGITNSPTTERGEHGSMVGEFQLVAGKGRESARG